MSFPNFQSPLYNFSGIDPLNPPNLFANIRAPTQYDSKGYKIGDIWINTTNGTAYILVSLAGNSSSAGSLATWDSFTNGSFSGGINQVTTEDTLVVTPDGSNNINIVGDHWINTTGSASPFPHTVTVLLDNTITLGDLVDVSGTPSVKLQTGLLDIVNGNAIVGNTDNNGLASEVIFEKSRTGGAIGSGDDLGAVVFQGHDGTAYVTGASIQSVNSGTVAHNRVAGDLEFYTHPDSTGALSQRVTIGTMGTVTINTPDSGNALTVHGDEQIIAGNLTLPNTTVANATGTIILGSNRFVSNYGTNNTFLGSLSGNASLTVVSAVNNVAVGSNAGTAITTGNHLAAVGSFALNAATTAQDSTAIGYGSLTSATTGDNNTGVGYSTLGSVTTSSNNTAVGYNALTNIVTGRDNIAVGFSAGTANTLADSSNIYIGNVGFLGESNTTRIGGGTGSGDAEQDQCFVSGINGVTLGAGFKLVTIDPATDQLGVVDSGGGGGITAVNTQTFTGNGTYHPSAGLAFALIEVVGGGGGGGGCGPVTGTQATAAAGGGGGGYARGLFSAADIGVSQTVTIGAGGTGGAAGGRNIGGNGGTTSVGALISASGGLGGNGALVTDPPSPGGFGGTGVGGDIQTVGTPGGNSIAFFGATGFNVTMAGVGGSSFFGGGGPPATTPLGSSQNGFNGQSFGGGGGGGAASGLPATGGGKGGNGFKGVVYITEYIA